MAGIGRKLTCAVVSSEQSVLFSNPFVSFQQFTEATVLSEGSQEYHMYPIWPGQRVLAIPFDGVFFIGEGDWREVTKEWSVLADACHRYVVGTEQVEEFFTLLFRPTLMRPEDCVNWRQRLLDDYQNFSRKLLTFFQIFDEENSGSFTVNTFSSKMSETIEAMGSTVLQHLYEDIDRHRDFKIDLDELETWWRKGRKGESRKLISAAVEKFLPMETALRDFPYEEHFTSISLHTNDSLPKPLTIDLRGQLGLCDELIPHIKDIEGSVWGFLLNAEEAGDALCEALKAEGMTESRVEGSVAFRAPLNGKKNSKWSFLHLTLKSAINPMTLSPESIIPALFSSYSFSACSNGVEGSEHIVLKKTGVTTLTARDIEQDGRNVPQELNFIWGVLKELGPNLSSPLKARLSVLPDDHITVFWVHPDSSAVLRVQTKGWKRVVASA